MPSLRRTISSPSVRSSPYPVLSSALNGGGPGSRPSGHRRSSGSETSTRRVLADIEWWRVADGQRDADADDEQDGHHHAPDSPSGHGLALEELLSTSVLFGAGMVPLAVGSQESPQVPPTSEFSALSISPQTPPRTQHARQASTSSVESTPEAAQPATFEGLRLSIVDTSLGALDPLPNFPVAQRGGGAGSGSTIPLFALRARSFSDFVSFGNENVGPFADFTVSPLSAAPDLCN
ncbi:hypothetical protein H0H87_003200 [Tephrocybe sp. NHM501043]|nr:hypothetical protein H0H87_003200 [Tephrocybe sp. NHM501043]